MDADFNHEIDHEMRRYHLRKSVHSVDLPLCRCYAARLWRILMRLLSLLIPLMLFAVVAVAEDARPKRLLLVSQGPDGHPPGTHEYVAGQQLLAQSLAK